MTMIYDWYVVAISIERPENGPAPAELDGVRFVHTTSTDAAITRIGRLAPEFKVKTLAYQGAESREEAIAARKAINQRIHRARPEARREEAGGGWNPCAEVEAEIQRLRG